MLFFGEAAIFCGVRRFFRDAGMRAYLHGQGYGDGVFACMVGFCVYFCKFLYFMGVFELCARILCFFHFLLRCVVF